MSGLKERQGGSNSKKSCCHENFHFFGTIKNQKHSIEKAVSFSKTQALSDYTMRIHKVRSRARGCAVFRSGKAKKITPIGPDTKPS